MNKTILHFGKKLSDIRSNTNFSVSFGKLINLNNNVKKVEKIIYFT